jgi:O-antigen/teichoic acid export membrane protein
MSVVKKNILANFSGSFLTSLITIVFIPLYIKYLGIEAWGIIGIFSTIQSAVIILDLGLSASMTREISKYSILPNSEVILKDIVRTLEVIYWITAIIIIFIIIISSHFITYNWLNKGNIDQSVIQSSIILMGFAIGLQWPSSLYSGGLVGLQKHVLLNIINVSINLLRSVGVVLILIFVNRSVYTFFIWQALVSLINSLVLYFFLWKNLPKTIVKATFKKEILSNIWKFAAGMSGISILALLLTQMDKVILSKTLSLKEFGYYTFASSIAMSLTRLYTPYFNSIYPRLTQLVALNNESDLKTFYHKSCQFLTFLILPITLVLCVYSYEIILLWTKSITLSQNVYLIFNILLFGTVINGFMNPPYALQLANGWTKLNLYSNILAVLIIIPCYFFLSKSYGSIGAAISWLILNIGYLIVLIPFMHKKLLKNEMYNWYLFDVGIPILIGGIIVLVSKLFLARQILSNSQMIITIAIVFIITFLSIGFSMYYTRNNLIILLKEYKQKFLNKKC